VASLGQDEQMPGFGRLYLSHLAAEIFNEYIEKPATKFNWLLTNKLKNLVEPRDDLVFDEQACF